MCAQVKKKYSDGFKQEEGIFGESIAFQIEGSDLMHPGMWRDFTKVTYSTTIADVRKMKAIDCHK